MSDRIRPSDLPYKGDRPTGVGFCKDNNGNLIWDGGDSFSGVITFPDLASFQAAGGAAAYGDGPVWIGGVQYNPGYAYAKLPGYILIGDSINALGNRSASCTIAATIGQTVATFTRSTHNLSLGSMFQVQGANQPEFNGVFTVASVVSTNAVTANLLSPATASAASGTPALTNLQTINDNNWAYVANCLSGHKALYLGNFAMGGSKSSQLNYQLDLGLNPANNLYGVAPDIVICATGINDATTDTDIEVTKSNIIAAYARAKAAGCLFVYMGPLPLNQGTANYSAARSMTARKLNDFFKNYKADGFVFFDGFSVCVDSANQYGNYLSGYSTDGIHPNKQGAWFLAKALNAQLFSEIISVDTRLKTVVNLNVSLAGTAGTKDGTGNSGDVADNYQMTAGGGGLQTVVGSKGVAYSGSTQSQRMTITAAAAGDNGRFRQTALPVSPGDKVVFRARMRSSGFNDTVRELRNRVSLNINGTYQTAAGVFDSNEIIPWLDGDFDMVFETAPFLIPAGVTLTAQEAQIQPYWRAAGSGTIDISEFEVFVL